MVIGTCYFPTIGHAIGYYVPYFNEYRDVQEAVVRKIQNDEIIIGKPALKKGQTLSLINDGLRYAITE